MRNPPSDAPPQPMRESSPVCSELRTESSAPAQRKGTARGSPQHPDAQLAGMKVPTQPRFHRPDSWVQAAGSLAALFPNRLANALAKLVACPHHAESTVVERPVDIIGAFPRQLELAEELSLRVAAVPAPKSQFSPITDVVRPGTKPVSRTHCVPVIGENRSSLRPREVSNGGGRDNRASLGRIAPTESIFHFSCLSAGQSQLSQCTPPPDLRCQDLQRFGWKPRERP